MPAAPSTPRTLRRRPAAALTAPLASTLVLALVALVAPVTGAGTSPAAAAPAARAPGAHHRGGHGLPPERVWLRDVAAALRGLPGYLEDRARDGGRPAIVLGIDNVALATHYDWPHAVRPTRRIVRRARALGMAVFFVTGRFRDELGVVRRPLRRAGFAFDGICGRAHGTRVATAKLQCRQALTDRGYTVTANIASHEQAFRGGYYERRVRLPDYGGRLR